MSKAFDRPHFQATFEYIAKLCNERNLSPNYMEPETPPGPYKFVDPLRLVTMLIETYGIQIQPREVCNWRPLSKARGRLTAFDEDVWILCTDGIVAWFCTWTGQPIFGHLANFDGPKDYWATETFDGMTVDEKRAEKRDAKVEALLADLGI